MKVIKDILSGFIKAMLILFTASLPLTAQTNENKKFFEYGIIQYAETLSFSVKNFLLPTETAFISVNVNNKITGKKGSRFHIPEYAFMDKSGKIVRGKVNITIQEIIDPMDFLISDISLEYTENGITEFFQSAGMFRIQAYKNNESLKLADGKKIIVEFPDFSRGNKFNVYKMNDKNQWILDKENTNKTSFLKPKSYSDLNGFKAKIIKVQAPPQEYDSTVFPRIVAIDSLNWWNFDLPYPHVACLKGTISDPDKILTEKYLIYSIGINYNGIFKRRESEKNNFKINAHKDRLVKILITDEKGNIGISDVISVSDKNGFDEYPEGPNNYCQPSGEIVIRKVDQDILNDRKKFSDYIQLPEEVYTLQENNEIDP